MKKRNMSTKSALIMSFIIMIACVAMLSGSTYAWYTASVSNTGNKIQAGTLGVVVQESATFDFSSSNILENGAQIGLRDVTPPITTASPYAGLSTHGDGSAYYSMEPGREYATDYLKVRNTGNLYVKFKLTLSIPAGSSNALAEHIDVYASRDDGTFSKINTLKNLLEDTDPDGFAWGTLSPNAEDANNVSAIYRIKLVVSKDIPNNLMGYKLNGLTINVAATQYSEEADGFGTKSYDAGAGYPDASNVVTTANGLTDLIDSVSFVTAKHANIILGNDITLSSNGESAGVIADVYGNVYINGNGHTITVPNGKTFIKTYAGANLHIENATIELSGSDSEAVFAEQFNSLTLKDVSIIGGMEKGLTIGSNNSDENSKVLIDGCSFNKVTMKLIGPNLNNVTIQNNQFAPYQEQAIIDGDKTQAAILFANNLSNVQITGNTFTGLIPYRINTIAPDAGNTDPAKCQLGTVSGMAFSGNTYNENSCQEGGETKYNYVVGSEDQDILSAFKTIPGITWQDTTD